MAVKARKALMMIRFGRYVGVVGRINNDGETQELLSLGLHCLLMPNQIGSGLEQGWRLLNKGSDLA